MCHWLCFGQTIKAKYFKLGMSTEVWHIQARGGSGDELPRTVGLILDVTCLFHPPTTTTNVLKLIQAQQEIFSLVHKTLKGLFTYL